MLCGQQQAMPKTIEGVWARRGTCPTERHETCRKRSRTTSRGQVEDGPPPRKPKGRDSVCHHRPSLSGRTHERRKAEKTDKKRVAYGTTGAAGPGSPAPRLPELHPPLQIDMTIHALAYRHAHTHIHACYRRACRRRRREPRRIAGTAARDARANISGSIANTGGGSPSKQG